MVSNKPLWTASLWVIFSLVLLIVLVIWALRPTLVTISGLMGKIESQRNISKQLEDKIATVQQAFAEMDSVATSMPLLEAAVPAEAQWNQLAGDLEKIATDSSLALIGITIAEIANDVSELKIDPAMSAASRAQMLPAGIIPVSFIFSASGNYADVKNAVRQIESLARKPLLRSVSITPNKEGNLDLTIIGEAIFIKPNEP